jgi:hypothetical protein
MRPSVLCFSIIVGPLAMFAETAARPHHPATALTQGSLVVAAMPVTRSASGSALFANVGPDCIRERRRFWVEDEGWVVRPVSTCRFQSMEVAEAHLCSNEQKERSHFLVTQGRRRCH